MNPDTDEYLPVQAAESVDCRERRMAAMICLLLAMLVLVVFGRTLHCGFVNYDDGLYVNESVPRLTWNGITHAFTHGSADNWDPLTTISHMADCAVYGLKPWGHHLTNVLLHTATVLLLFLVLRQMTGALWRSAVVAVLFAIHPLRVESVAWIAERKDVLSGFFFMLTLWAYGHYTRSSRRQEAQTLEPTLEPPHVGCYRSKAFWYVTLLGFFALGLLSKPMLVTTPFVLLLLDYWPLKRVSGAEGQGSGVNTPVTFHVSRFTLPVSRFTFQRLVVEKIPLLLLSAAICVVTLSVQMPAMKVVEPVSLSVRLGNALVSYAAYLGQTIWPAQLTVFYPYPKNGWPPAVIILSAGVLAVLSTGAFFWRRSRPWLLVGWWWYLGMLVPVIGFIQVGLQSRADRYTYLPQIGLFVALVWTAALFLERAVKSFRFGAALKILLPVAIAVVLSLVSFVQIAHWRDSESLWTHALACTRDNVPAHNNLGAILLQNGRTDEALRHYQQVLELKPGAASHNNFGAALLHSGRTEDAIVHFEKSVALQPDYGEAHDNLGIALSQVGRIDDAIVHFRRAVEIRADNGEAHYNLGFVLLMNGRADESVVHFEKALALQPDDAAAHANLGLAFVRTGRLSEGIDQYETALKLQADNAEACRNLAWVLATCPDGSVRNGRRAVALAEKANRLSGGGDLAFLGTVAAAYAEAGAFTNAVAVGKEALRLADAQGDERTAEAIRRRIGLYETGVPFRDDSLTNRPSAPMNR